MNTPLIILSAFCVLFVFVLFACFFGNETPSTNEIVGETVEPKPTPAVPTKELSHEESLGLCIFNSICDDLTKYALCLEISGRKDYDSDYGYCVDYVVPRVDKPYTLVIRTRFHDDGNSYWLSVAELNNHRMSHSQTEEIIKLLHNIQQDRENAENKKKAEKLLEQDTKAIGELFPQCKI